MSAKHVNINTGDRVLLRKAHPCGCFEWEIIRVGMDIGLKCMGCAHKVVMKRSTFERGYRKHVDHTGESDEV